MLKKLFLSSTTLILLFLVQSVLSLNTILLRNELRRRSSQQEINYKDKKLMAKIYDHVSKNLSESNYYHLEKYWIFSTTYAIIGIVLIMASIILILSEIRYIAED